MRIQHILLASLFASLYGCQQEVPAPKASSSAAIEPSATSAPSLQPAQPDQAQTIVPASMPASADAAAQPASRVKIAAAEKKTTAQAVVAEKPVAAQASSVPVINIMPAAAGTRPETESEPAASEADAMQLAKKSNCFACHAIDRKVVGPSFKDVSDRYRGDAEAKARLMNKIARGGSGVWGVMVMPPSPQLGEADRKTLAGFVLSLK